MSDSFLRLALDVRRATRQGVAGIARRQRERLAEIVAYARANAPYFRRLYHGLPAVLTEPSRLPVTRKPVLMASFDDWVTDHDVTHERVRAFVADPDLIGARFLGRHTVATTSGTTGERGNFLMDDHSMTVTKALAVRMLSAWLRPRDLFGLVAHGGRIAMINATGGHFASAVAGVRLRKGSERLARRVLVLSAHTPLAALVEQLNRFQPAILAPYASVGAMLAHEQEAGRLHIRPSLVVLSAEGLVAPEYDRIGRAFRAKVGHSYAATECPFLSYSCAKGWLHVNADWVILEPVDAEYQPTLPGEQSHTVLVSNLANRLQPILRYDLGDSVVQRPNPCPCGNPLPAIRVQGRSGDVLAFPSVFGDPITIAPLAVTSLLARIPGIERFQVEQTERTTLRLRLRASAGHERELVWVAGQAELATLLKALGLAHVLVERDDEPPRQSPGGKYREIIPLRRETT